jgi:hypothetical protein
MKLISLHPTPLFADNGEKFVKDANRWIRDVNCPTKRRYRLAPADELEMLREIMLQVQTRLCPQTTWLSPDPRDTTEKALRWDSPQAANRLELRVSPSVIDGGLTITLSAGFLPEVSDLMAQGHGFSDALQISSQANGERKLCFWRLAPITVADGFSKKEQHLGQMNIFRLDMCDCNKRRHLTHLDYKAPCLDGKERYFPDYLYPRPERGGLVDDIVRVTQGFLVAAGIAS